MDPVLLLIVIAVAANLVVMALIVVPPLLGRPSPIAPVADASVDVERRAAEAAVIGGISGDKTDDGVPTETYDRVVRIVSWIFLLATTAIVATTDLWPSTAAGDPAPARVLGTVHRHRPRPAAARHARPGQVRRRGVGRDHGRDAPGGPDRGRGQPVLLRLPADRRWRRAGRLAADHGRAGRGRRDRLRPCRDRGIRRGPARPGGRGRGRDQPDRPDPAAVRRDGHRPRPAPDPRCGDPAVDRRFADRAVQPLVLLRGDGPRDRPERPVRARLLPADDGSRRAQDDQRPARPLLRRPGPAGGRRGDQPGRAARSIPPRATAATSSSCSCPRPIRPAASCSPRRSGSGSMR